MECGEHSKKPTRKTRTEETQITDDGQVIGVKPDTVHYVSLRGDGRGVRAPIVLVMAQARDGTADLVVDALLTRGADVARIDTADFPGSLSLAATPDCLDSPGYLCANGRRIDLASVRSVYRRSPASFTFPDGMSAPEQRFATLESVYGLGGVLAAQPWRWIDRPGAVADASYKPRQLRVAAQCGLTVPRSLVTDPHRRRASAEERKRHGSKGSCSTLTERIQRRVRPKQRTYVSTRVTYMRAT